jgi:hypothetical protein
LGYGGSHEYSLDGFGYICGYFNQLCFGFGNHQRGIPMVQANKKNTVYSAWVPLQVYSGDDSLGHPDLEKISKLQESKLMEEVESN